MSRIIIKGMYIFWCWVFLYLTAGYVTAAISPDSVIRADLQTLFADPPSVQGYPYQDLLETAAARYGLPLPFVLAVVRGESFFDPKAKSLSGARGLMQIMPETAADYGWKPDDLFDPAANIDAGVRYLADLYKRLEDPYLTLAAYYCGCGGVDKEEFTLRQDCDEYVHYIHTHLKKILADAGRTTPDNAINAKRFVLVIFDNFLDAENFLNFLSKKLPERQFDLFRSEVEHPDHVRYQYQIQATYVQEVEKDEIRRTVEKATGFNF